HCLNVWDQSKGNLFFQVRVNNLFLLPFLPCGQHCFARFIVHDDSAALFLCKTFACDLLSVNERKRQTVNKHGTKLLHQVQRERRAARPILVQKSNIRVQSHRLQRRGGFIRQQRVKKREQGVHIIQRRAAIAFLEEKVFALLQNQLVE